MHRDALPRVLLLVALLAADAAAGPLDTCSLSTTGGAGWTPECDQAIGTERDPKTKAQLLFRRAYQLNESEKYEAAVKDLDQACDLDPHNPGYLMERGYTLNSLGRYADALKDLDEGLQLQPESVLAHNERALSRRSLADFQGWYEDRDKLVALEPNDPSRLIARAEARLWLGQFAQVRADIKAAEAASLSEQGRGHAEDVLRKLDLWTGSALSADTQHASCTDEYAYSGKGFLGAPLIAACSADFLAAKDSAAKAKALSIRSMGWIAVEDSEASPSSVEDAQAASALDPTDPYYHANLGSKYLQSRHSWGAKQEFERSLAIKRTPFALAGRASANYNLGDKKGAFTDAKASFELEPNFLCLMVLGDLAADRNDKKSAKLYYMGAYHMGIRDDGLMTRLKQVGVDHPEQEK